MWPGGVAQKSEAAAAAAAVAAAAVSRLARGTTLLSALHYCRDSVRVLCSLTLVFAAVEVLIAEE